MNKTNIYPLLLLFFIVFNCSEDNDDNFTPATASEISDFVWKGMNAVYLYKSDVPDLANNRFNSDQEYADYLNSFNSPEILFESLIYKRETVDRFSSITSNYIDLIDQLNGNTSSKGFEFNLYIVPGSDTQVFGVITLVLNNSVADNLDLKRGMVFRAIDGVDLTVDNRSSLLNQTTFTLNFADFNVNNNAITLNGESATLTSEPYSENPIHIAKIVEVDGIKVGYLMYNAFNHLFDENLNNVFGDFKSNNVEELVLDLRYNGGGSVQTAVYLGSMITGQYTGDVFSKLFYNENLQNNNRDLLFTNSIVNGSAINSLNLSKVYVLTTNRRTASASELVINALNPYSIDVVVIGENTVGKTQANTIIYDSPGLTNSQDVNLGHNYALFPLIANSVNVNDRIVPANGISPTIQLQETPSNLGILGDVNEPLFAEALSLIQDGLSTSSVSSISKSSTNFIDVNNQDESITKNSMYVDIVE